MLLWPMKLSVPLFFGNWPSGFAQAFNNSAAIATSTNRFIHSHEWIHEIPRRSEISGTTKLTELLRHQCAGIGNIANAPELSFTYVDQIIPTRTTGGARFSDGRRQAPESVWIGCLQTLQIGVPSSRS